MTRIKDAASEFLAHRRVAVTGVSRTPGNHASNVVYKRLRERSYQVLPVNRIRTRSRATGPTNFPQLARFDDVCFYGPSGVPVLRKALIPLLHLRRPVKGP
jgi:predicted CoA-binding protein